MRHRPHANTVEKSNMPFVLFALFVLGLVVLAGSNHLELRARERAISERRNKYMKETLDAMRALQLRSEATANARTNRKNKQLPEEPRPSSH